MKILLDMNISPRWVEYLQANDVEAVHWLECGAPDAPDCDLMEYARANGFAVFTHMTSALSLPQAKTKRQASYS